MSDYELTFGESSGPTPEELAAQFETEVDRYLNITKLLSAERAAKATDETNIDLGDYHMIAFADENPLRSSHDLLIDILMRMGYSIELTPTEVSGFLCVYTGSGHKDSVLGILRHIRDGQMNMRDDYLRSLIKTAVGYSAAGLLGRSPDRCHEELVHLTAPSRLAHSISVTAQQKRYGRDTDYSAYAPRLEYYEIAQNFPDTIPLGPEEIAGMVSSLVHSFLEENPQHKLENIS